MKISTLTKKAQLIFNKYIRERDRQGDWFVCISCGKSKQVDEMDAGHYVPRGSSSFLRFSEFNVHGECTRCNRFDDFHLVGYRKNLIEKIGLKAVEDLEESRSKVKRWTKSELEEIIKRYERIPERH